VAGTAVVAPTAEVVAAAERRQGLPAGTQAAGATAVAATAAAVMATAAAVMVVATVAAAETGAGSAT